MRWLAVLMLVAGACVPLRAEELVRLPAGEGITQTYLLLPPAGAPRAAAILFPGGGGRIRLRLEDGAIAYNSSNFLVRSRHEFAARGVAAAVVDAPSDHQTASGMDDHFRLGERHHADLSAVVADLRKRYPGVKLFLVGTSRGTISAAALGLRMGAGVDGVVLTATVFVASRRGARPGLSGFDFGTIKAPLLFVHHRRDGCQVTPYGDAARLAPRFPLISVDGGSPATSPPCEALSEHGFLGRESATVDAIVKWMLQQPYPAEIE